MQRVLQRLKMQINCPVMAEWSDLPKVLAAVPYNMGIHQKHFIPEEVLFI